MYKACWMSHAVALTMDVFFLKLMNNMGPQRPGECNKVLCLSIKKWEAGAPSLPILGQVAFGDIFFRLNKSVGKKGNSFLCLHCFLTFWVFLEFHAYGISWIILNYSLWSAVWQLCNTCFWSASDKVNMCSWQGDNMWLNWGVHIKVGL